MPKAWHCMDIRAGAKFRLTASVMRIRPGSRIDDPVLDRVAGGVYRGLRLSS